MFGEIASQFIQTKLAVLVQIGLLEEPTTGLHFADTERLNRLVESGHRVVVIEHNRDVTKTADYVIDLGALKAGTKAAN